jgi:hypothetical protein
MKTTTFESARLGDRVWSITKGWGKIVGIDNNAGYPLQVKWDSAGIDTFTFDGYLLRTHATRTLFWDEVKIPRKPAPDAAILVETLESIAEYWNQDSNEDAMRDACEYAQTAAQVALAAYRKGGDLCTTND